MIFSVLKLVHVLAVILWVGGMAFAHFFLRPPVQALEPPVRLKLLHAVMKRFLGAVLAASLVVLVSGLWMIGRMAKEAVQAGLDFRMPLAWTIMATLGIVMIAVFGHIRFALFKRLSRAVEAGEWPSAGAAMASIRTWVFVNLCIGIVVICVAVY